MIVKLAAIAGLSVVGTLARFGLQSLFPSPWATFAVNAAGCFLIGLVGALAQAHKISEDARTIVFVGFLGALTTFSSFAWETLTLERNGQVGLAFINVGAQVIVGLALAYAGYAVVSR